MSKKMTVSKQTTSNNKKTIEHDKIACHWTAKTQKVVTDKMRVCAENILKTTDSAENFLKRAGIVTKKGNLARAYR